MISKCPCKLETKCAVCYWEAKYAKYENLNLPELLKKLKEYEQEKLDKNK